MLFKISKIILIVSMIFLISGCDSKNQKTDNMTTQQNAQVNSDEGGDDNEQDPSQNASASNNSQIEAIRSSTMEQYNKALTIGQAFDGWKYCHDQQWSSKVGERGENMVIFKCTLNDDLYKFDSENLKPNFDTQHIFVAFTINADGQSFDASSLAIETRFKDGKSYFEEQPVAFISSIFNNTSLGFGSVRECDYKRRQ